MPVALSPPSAHRSSPSAARPARVRPRRRSDWSSGRRGARTLRSGARAVSSRPMRVMKFGGAALRDGPAIQRSARLVERSARTSRVLVVVSAQEGVTAQLARAADEATRGRLDAWDALRVRHRSALAWLGLPGDLLDRHLLELRAILDELAPRADRRMRDYVRSFGERMSARVFAAVLRQLGAPATPLDAYDLGLTTASVEGEGALLLAPRPELRARLEAVPGIPVVTGFLALD